MSVSHPGAASLLLEHIEITVVASCSRVTFLLPDRIIEKNNPNHIFISGTKRMPCNGDKSIYASLLKAINTLERRK